MDLQDQADELSALGISVIDHEALEENVEAAVDNALAEHGRKQKLQILKKEIKDSIFELKKLLNKEREYTFKLSGMKNRLTDPRLYLATETLLLENGKLITELRSRRKYLEHKLLAAEIDKAELDDFDLDLEDGELLDDDEEVNSTKSKPSESEKDKLIREGKMTPFGTYLSFESLNYRSPSILGKKNIDATLSKSSDNLKVGVKCRRTNNSLCSSLDQVLGTDISSHKRGDDGSEMQKLETYLKDQVVRQRSHAEETDVMKRKKVGDSFYGVPAKRKKKLVEFVGGLKNKSTSKSAAEYEKINKESPLKLKILHPKRFWKESNIGSFTSESEADKKKKSRRPLSESVALDYSESDNNSDSDYVPSDQEISSDHEYQETSQKINLKASKNKKLFKKNHVGITSPKHISKRVKKIKDDGHLEDYKHRIKLWRLERLKSKHKRIANDEDPDSEDEENEYEEFSGAYKIPLSIWNKLYKYQKTCVRWLWELHCQGCGGILGDEMGLGKTIEVISFLVGLSYSGVTCSGQKWRGLGPVLIVSPATVLHQWVKEFQKWWPPFRVAILHDSGTFVGKRPALIHNINRNNGILVTSYSGLTTQLKTLLQYEWHYIILDEGHKIRNPEAQITVAVKRFKTSHRFILSGSPIQNSLKELWSLFDFVFPGKLGTLPVFLQQFAVPITQGGYANASKLEVQTAFRCATILRDTINPYLLRRMKNDVRNHLSLPDKNEQVLFCGLTEEQRTLYREYISGSEIQCIMKGRMKIFVGLINLRKICNHPDLYSGGPKHFVGEDISGLQPELSYGWWKRAGKMIVLHAVLKLWHKQGHRILLFTQSRQMMCILEKFLQDQCYSYLKMDGSTCVGSRQPLIEKYNNDSSIFVFLLTTRVGGLGVNLTGADRVIIFDPDWNPSTDTQARERAWRIGQTRHVTIYRFLTAGTIEEKIYHRQIFKQFLTNRVLKDPKQQRFFKSNDLFELFTLNEGDKNKTESASIFAGIGSEIKVQQTKKIRLNDINKTESASVLAGIGSESKVKLTKKRRSNDVNESSFKNGIRKNDPPKLEEKSKECDESDEKEEIFSVEEYSKGGTEMEDWDETAAKVNGNRISNNSNDNTENIVSTESIKVEDKSFEQTKTITPLDNSHDCNAGSECHKNLDLTSALSKREKMMQLAKQLSKQIEKNKLNKSENAAKEKKIKKENKKGKKFEGERIEYLVKKRKMKYEYDEEEKKAITKSQDEFVLEKLFKKSGVHTALSHDVIVNSGDPDYLLLESEAERVAKEAMKKVRLSRRFLKSQNGTLKHRSNVPLFGSKSSSFVKLDSKAKRNLKSKRKSKSDFMFAGGMSEDESSDHEDLTRNGSLKSDNVSGISEFYNKHKEGDSSGSISSSQLLKRMRDRNRASEQLEESIPIPNIDQERLNVEEGFDPAYPSTAETECPLEEDGDPELEVHIDLLADIRNFVAFQATLNGCASTKEIVERFKQRLPPDQSHIFKALLNEICDFRRNSSREGMWYIKGEFR